jgi:Regulator of chromosome condensation (RCC1) repeat
VRRVPKPPARLLLGAALLAGCGVRAPEAPTVVVATPSPAPAEPPGPPAPKPSEAPPPIELAATWSEVCVRVNGRVHCGGLDDPDRPLAAEPPLGGIEDAVSLAAGRSFLCLATARGTVHCRGENRYGQLGARLPDDQRTELVQVAGLHDARRVVTGSMHACAILASGRVSCWGSNQHGETGGPASYATEARELVVPVEVPLVEGASSVAASRSTTCAATSARELWCWGKAETPEHQRARGDQSEVPLRLAALAGTSEPSAGESTLCGVREGAIRCWGPRWSLAPGDGPAPDGMWEVPAPGAVRRVRLADHHGCALLVDGRVACFGSSYGGVLGVPGPSSFDAQPARVVPAIPRAVDVAVGPSLSCAVTAAGEAYCWGTFPGKNARKEPAPARVPIRG